MAGVAIFLAAGLFGMTTFPIWSISAAHAHNFTKPSEAAALMFLYAVGAIASPLIASLLIDLKGPAAMFVFSSLAHIVLAGVGLWRMRMRAAPQDRTRYEYVPRTSFLIGRLLRRGRKRD